MDLSRVGFLCRHVKLESGAIGRDARLSQGWAQVSDLLYDLFPRHITRSFAEQDCYGTRHAGCPSRRRSIRLAIASGVRAAMNSLSGIVTWNSSSSARSNSNTRTDEKPAR